MRALLDVNVLIALLDGAHVHHAAAQAWMARAGKTGWASCPLTQNGCIRIMTQPSYPSAPFLMQDVVSRLAEAARSNHEFWPDDINTLETSQFQWPHILGHRQLTDVYLLGLAVKHEGRFVTFDRRLSLRSVKDAAPAHYQTIQ